MTLQSFASKNSLTIMDFAETDPCISSEIGSLHVCNGTWEAYQVNGPTVNISAVENLGVDSLWIGDAVKGKVDFKLTGISESKLKTVCSLLGIDSYSSKDQYDKAKALFESKPPKGPTSSHHATIEPELPHFHSPVVVDLLSPRFSECISCGFPRSKNNLMEIPGVHGAVCSVRCAQVEISKLKKQCKLCAKPTKQLFTEDNKKHNNLKAYEEFCSSQCERKYNSLYKKDKFSNGVILKNHLLIHAPELFPRDIQDELKSIKCKYCEEKFTPKRSDSVFCKPTCKKNYQRYCEMDKAA